jgi:serine protease Do
MEMIRRSGQQGVPVVATEDEVILGFDEPRLARLAEKYAAPRRQPLGVLAANAEEYLARHPEKADSIPAGTKGVFVGKIRADTAAERAGLQVGDVIVSFAGKRLRTMAQLDQFVATLKAGDQATVRFLRDGKEATATIQF